MVWPFSRFSSSVAGTQAVFASSGISTNLSSRVSHLSPNWNDAEQDFDLGFYKALDLTRLEFLDRVNYYGKVWWAARDIVSTCIQNRFSVHQSGRVLEFVKGDISLTRTGLSD